MYLLAIHVPIYKDGARLCLTNEWLRSLLLLRNSLAPRFPGITLLAPWRPASEARNYGQALLPADREDGLTLVPSFELRGHTKDYWLHLHPQWTADLTRHIAQAEAVHADLDDLYRPIAYSAFRMAVRMGKPTIFVQDTDIAHQARELPGSFGARLQRRIYASLYERACRTSVRAADLTLLKGNRLMDKYGAGARWAQKFHDTSHSERSVISAEKLEARLHRPSAGRALRLVYMGRFVPRKGVDQSIEIVHRARARGADVRFDLIGDGPERARLEALVARLGLQESVTFLGPQPYGPEFLETLSGSYDALLFTPLAEDTPRMIFDGYAAGLPLIASPIDYCRERAQEEQAALLLPAGDLDSAGKAVAELGLRREDQLPRLSRRAREAGRQHSAENWYRKRTEWTIEAIRRHQSARRS